MSVPPDQPKSETWTDGGPGPGGPKDKSFAYRQSRKAFIAACEKAGADVVGRVHPQRAPDGGPLFLDAAAFGPRLARSGVLVVAAGPNGAGVLLALLSGGIARDLPPGVRLVLIHGADPAGFAWNDPGRADPAWGAAMLKAVVTEDLRKADRLQLVRLGDAIPVPALGAGVTVRDTCAPPDGAARKAVAAALAAVG